ncbi:MAG: Mov34/MPN/PAD-1 family protein [Methanomassiliicoccaceae archaeon]|jgi:proteasome lid subunit RPN8/RPN11|nr:Mov34/MPN/PAD-1 family protein [Methanomassiliicoccaceae archaeon]
MKRIRAISWGLIDAVNESARSCYPQEFLCLTRQTDGVVDELLLIPGTIYGDSHGFLNMWMSPIDFTIAGTVHSHPGYSNEPSDADIDFFSSWGGIHIITCQPYDRRSWKAYDSKGCERDMEMRD